LERTFTVPIGWQLNKDLKKVVCVLNKHPVYGMISSIVRIDRSRNEGVEKGIVPLTVTLSDPLGTFFLLPVPLTLSLLA